MIDILCKIGFSLSDYLKMKQWLDEDAGRRLFFIDESGEHVVDDPKVKIFHLETPLQREIIARKVGSLSAFKKLQVIGLEWEREILQAQLAAEMLLSEWADFGVKVARHKTINARRTLRSMEALRGTKAGVPAVIVGAGPSLEECERLIACDRAFVIAAGNGVELLEKAPHLALSVCPHNPLVRTRHKEVPLCIQARVHPESAEGASLLLDEAFDIGWTVGNGAVALALLLGCNPIVLVGMDLCCRGLQKYAKRAPNESGGLVETVDRLGKKVWTQRDWILSARWIEECAKKNPEVQFYNASEKGLDLGVPVRKLDSFAWPKRSDLPLDVNAAPFCKIPAPDLEELTELIWKVWEPVFERELMVDPNAQKMEIQKGLLLDQVREEYDRKEGLCETFYESGQLRTSETFCGGVRDGAVHLYWPNGQLKRRCAFACGARVGKEEFWTEEGVLFDEQFHG